MLPSKSWQKFTLDRQCSEKSVWPDEEIFNTVHHMTAQDASLGSSSLVSNVTKSDEIP